MTHATHTTVRPSPRSGARSGRGRRGFSLIELLTVLGIIGVLLAISSAALQKTRVASNYNRTSEYVSKLQKALGAERDQVNAKARNADMPSFVLAYCDGSPSRALALYTALEQRRNFPTTFVEATTSAFIVTTSSGTYGLRLASVPANTTAVGSLQNTDTVVYTHAPLTQFTTEVTSLPGTPSNPNQESGALLYIILSKQSATGGGAMAQASDDLTAGQRQYVTFGTTQKYTYWDGFKNPLGFNRWDNRAEVQAAPYIDPQAAYIDPLDPQNLLFGWSNPTKQKEVYTLLQFAGQNRVLNVYSYGYDGVASADDVLGFRTLQPGNKGY